MSKQEYHSNGKLLLTGEYLVLKGAKALALPLKYGQDLSVSPLQKSKEILWKTFVKNRLWFEATFDQELNIIDTTFTMVAQKLQKILRASLELNGLPVQAISGNQVTSTINFDIEWGFGSSSSLLSNIGYWLKVSPFQLQFETSNGSGYDIAAARSEHPIIYSLKNNQPVFTKADFDPDFKNHMYFIYLGKKQHSEESVEQFNQNNISSQAIEEISEITEKAIEAKTISVFNDLLKRHNNILSAILKKEDPGNTLFKDFKGVIKPLGAWGGDFIMATSTEGPEYVKSYFSGKKYEPVFSYKDLAK
ncbi:MAG TPA: GYDIA family GHMP kinase [Bacteroidales bacterium]|nr:GYDIA family GHMP kinase [Bacteroidales bacterium]